MPRLWNQTVEAHRREVRDAVLDATWALVTARGLTAATMSQIAEDAGIGRATLYKYFPDVEAILVAWHQRHVAVHLEHLTELARQPGPPGERLEAVLSAYALISHHRGRHAPELVTLLHRNDAVARAQLALNQLIITLLIEATQAGNLRGHIAPDELALFCLHALGAAAHLPDEPAVDRLVAVTLAGLTFTVTAAPPSSGSSV